MKLINNLCLVILVSILQVSFVFASGPSIRFEHLSLEDGLPQSVVSRILQDRQGFLWVGTQDGLARYDGYRFKVFKHNSEDPHSLSMNNVFPIFEDSQGDIWVGTRGSGLNRFNPQTEQFSHYRFDASNPSSLSNDFVWVITQDHLGTLWVGTDGGLNRFNAKTEQFSHYRFDVNNPNSLSNDRVLDITEDQQGMLWLGTLGGGLNRFNPKTEQFSHYRFDANNPNSLSNDKVVDIMQDRQGTLWLGTAGGGLNRFNAKTEQFSHYRFDSNNPNSLNNNNVLSIIEDQQGILWLGTNGGGINRFNPKTEQFSHSRFNASNPNSLSNDVVWGVTEDRQGTIWVGTHGGGLSHFNPKVEQFGPSRSDASKPNGLSHNIVFAITEDKLGALWLGTYGGGLNHISPKTGQFNHYRFDANNPNSLSDDFVYVITQDHQGTIWVGTRSEGLNRFNPKTEKFSHYRFDASNPSSLSDDRVRVITEDHMGTLWIGTSGGGFNRFNPKTEKFSHYRLDVNNPNSLSHNNIYAITEDRHGLLWIGTSGGGLNRFNPKTEQFNHYRFDANDPNSLSDDRVYAITEDYQGTLWLGTTNGLNKLDRQTGKFKRFNEKEGLPNNVIYRIEEDNDGFLWLSTNHGLSRFNPKTERFKNYDVGDGLQSNEFNAFSSFKSKRGELFFGGINGFNRFFPDKIIDDKQKPRVVFTDMLLLNQSVTIKPIQEKLKNEAQSSDNGFTLAQAINVSTAITLTHLENLVSFEFSALHFINPKKNQYAYQLEGFDADWIETGYKNRRATYTNLPSGDYVLRVKASNSNSVWNEEGASLKITVLPPPWMSWWAYSLYIMIIFGLLYGFVQSQRNKKKHLKELVLERTKELDESNMQLTQTVKELGQAQTQLVKVEKMAALGNLVTGVAHELNTPLGIITTSASVQEVYYEDILQHIRDNQLSRKHLIKAMEGIKDAGKLITRNINRSTNLTHSFKLIGGDAFDEEISTIKIKEIIDLLVISLNAQFLSKNISLNFEVDKDQTFCGYKNSFSLVIEQLILNSITHAFPDSIKHPAINIEFSLKKTNLVIHYFDNGIGLNQQDTSKIFEPFFTSNRAKGSVGLGMHIVFNHVTHKMQGKVDIDENYQDGFSAYIYIPIQTKKEYV